jgi:hypothetical protein
MHMHSVTTPAAAGAPPASAGKGRQLRCRASR